MSAKIIALVPAAGTGTRLGDSLPKQYLDLNGKPMIFHALAALAKVNRISSIAVVLSPADQHWRTYQADWETLGARISVFMVGGKSRGESVANGLQALDGELAGNDWVLVHDAARPCIRTEMVEQFIDELENDPIGGLLALPLADTIKTDDGGQRVAKTIPREGIWRAQTPQMFRYALLRRAMHDFVGATDESQAIEALGQAPRLVTGEPSNLKVTYARDMSLARILLKEDATS
jgi:2-C-methyl-D-erythritol 4-phosphate cytidylyltransferase